MASHVVKSFSLVVFHILIRSTDDDERNVSKCQKNIDMK